MNLFYRIYGKGQPLLILHGIFGLSDNWVSYGKRISELGFEVMILDQRNHGRSPHSDTFNYYALVDDLTEFMDYHNITDPVLLGHSMGGKVIMRYALENPKLVSKIISVDVSLRTYTTHSDHRQLISIMQSVNFDKDTTRQDVVNELEAKISSPRIRQFLAKNLHWKDRDQLGWRINLDALSENLDSMYDGVFYSSKFNGPALFVKGGESNYVNDEDEKEIMERFPDSQIETIPHGTHWVHADDPEEFYKITANFLSK
ncbi:alpha/beta fold hydrolase [Bacteroidota bacterium]